jgi:hypothetical protein
MPYIVMCAQNLPHASTRRNFSGAPARLFQPFRECPEFHRVLDRRISRQDSDREILTDILDLGALADGPEP